MPTNRPGFDEFGNPAGKAYDLGSFDDQRLKGEKILFCIACGFYLEPARRLVVKAVAERNLQMEIVSCDNFDQVLKKLERNKYTQLWYLSGDVVYLEPWQIQAIKKFNEEGNGLLLWADNEPLYADANLLAKTIVGTTFSGNKMADQILKPGPKLKPGAFIEHSLTTGLNSLYEGDTICTVAPAPGVTILAQSHDGQNCMACFEQGRQRVVLDTGFTKIYDESRFYKTPGTARYLSNIAFWLARGIRDSQYKLLTTPEQIATIKQGQVSTDYGYNLKTVATLMFILSWQGSGELGLEIQQPAGAIYKNLQNKETPIKLEISNAQPGLWKCRVRGVRVPGSDFPYVLTVVERKPGVATSPAPAKPAAQTSSPEALWPCYLLIDCSKLAADVAPKIGQGIGIFLRSLRAVSVPGITPTVSFLECREGNAVINPLARLADLAPLTLSCIGEPKLVLLLNGLINILEKNSTQARGKPLVVIVLAAEPRDNFQPAADRLRQMAVQGKINVMAVGVDNGVLDATLTRLATIPLRVTDPHGNGAMQCFDWLSRVVGVMMTSLNQSGGGAAINLPPLPPEVKWLR